MERFDLGKSRLVIYYDQCEGKDCIAYDLIGKLVKLKKPFETVADPNGRVYTWGVIKDHWHNWRGNFVFGLYLMTDEELCPKNIV